MREAMGGCLVGGVLLPAAVLASSGPVWGHGAAPPQDPLAGSRVFGAKGCVRCHAVNGIGGRVGPDLARIARPRSFYDLTTAMWNHLPRMSERMQQLGIMRPHLEVQEAADLIGFLYTLNFAKPGSIQRGWAVATSKDA